MRPDLTSARTLAERTLTDHAVLAIDHGDTNDDDGRLIPGEPEPVWAGPVSLSPATMARSTGWNRGDEQILVGQICRLPASAPVAVGLRLYLNPTLIFDDLYDLDGHEPLVVAELLTRTTQVLQRVRVVTLTEHQEVPK